MHTFQPLPFDLVEFNPFTKIGKEWALVTAGNKEKANTMTVSWGGVGVLWGKNVAFIFVRDSRYTKEFIDANEFFSITFLSGQYRDALNYCGSHSRITEDSFLLPEIKEKWYKDGDMHTMYVAEIIDILAR